MIQYSENLPYLKSWIDTILSRINSLRSSKKSNEIIVFMIGTTANFSKNSKPYLTPTRTIANGYVIGSIVYSQTQAAILSSKVDGLVDYFFVDVEKKIPLIINPDIRPYKYFNLNIFQPEDNNRIELGNISSMCKDIIKTSIMHEYKGNDITLESVWMYLVNIFSDLSGLKIVIYGTGNIGNKLALKLAESGANIHMVTRNQEKSSLIASALNNIKHKYVLSNISISTNDIYSSIDADAVIGCTNSEPVISPEMVMVMNSNGVVVDVGKGTISTDAIRACAERNIRTWRADITPMIGSLVLSATAMNDLLSNKYGRRLLECGVYVVSGGYIGNKYDVIVDSYRYPKELFGVCSDAGKILIEYDEIAKKNLLKVEKVISSYKNS